MWGMECLYLIGNLGISRVGLSLVLSMVIVFHFQMQGTVYIVLARWHKGSLTVHETVVG